MNPDSDSSTKPVLDPDALAGGSYLHALAHLTTPLSGGAGDIPVAVDDDGRVRVEFPSRRAVLLAAPRASLGATALLVRATVTDGAGTRPLPDIEFAAWSDAQSFLPLYRPTDPAGPFTVSLGQVVEIGVDGHAGEPIPSTDLHTLLVVRLLSGNLGRLLYVLGNEHARIRRQAREIGAARALSVARDSALDRLGAELAVPRFTDHPTVLGGRVELDPRPEPDREYRRRLRIYRPLLLRTGRGAMDILNGPGADNDVNRGPLGELGFIPRLRLVEGDRPVAVAVHPFVVGPTELRDRFHRWLQDVHLVDPATDVPASRFLPAARRTAENALRARLRTHFDVPAGVWLAPALAAALDRVGRCRAALGQASRRQILTPGADAPPSRYELSLGIDLAVPDADELDRMATRLADPNRPPAANPADEHLLRTLSPQSGADDPDGRWLLTGCGLRTAHHLTNDRTYVSPLPSDGLAVVGPSTVAVPEQFGLVAYQHAPSDPGDHVDLERGMARFDAAWQAAGEEPVTTLTESEMSAAFQGAAPADPPVLAVVRAAGLPDPPGRTTAYTIGILLQTRLLRVTRVGAQLAATTLSGDAAAVPRLARMRSLLAEAGLASAVVVVIPGAGQVVLACGLIGLPAAGRNLGDRRATGFRWQFAPLLGGGPGPVETIENIGVFTPPDVGVYAAAVLSYAQQSDPDPFQVRTQPTAPGLLSFLGYEWLMNALDHVRPLGVEVDTSVIRQQFVDPDGDGVAGPLPDAVARAFRPFRRRPQPPPKSPEVTGVEPAQCQQNSGAAVSIRGRMLAGTSAVTFDGPGMTVSVIWSTDTQVQAQVSAAPDTPTGPRTFRLQTPRGTVPSPIAFTVTPRPAVVDLAPRGALAGMSVPVTITGRRLAGATEITFDSIFSGITVTDLVSTESTVTAVLHIAANADAGDRYLTVLTPLGRAESPIPFEVGERPRIGSLSPTEAVQGADPLHVTITGIGLTGATAIEFAGGGITAEVLAGGTDTTLPARVTVGREAALGARTFLVRTPLAPPLDVADSAELGVWLIVSPRPRITGLSRLTAQAGDPQFELTIYGSALSGVAAVEFAGGGISADVLTGGTATTVRVRMTIAADASPGPRPFTILTQLPSPLDRVDSTESDVTLVVTPRPQPPEPVIIGIEPTDVDRSDGLNQGILISGTGLLGATQIVFRRVLGTGSKPTLAGIVGVSDTQIDARIYVGPVGDYWFRVTTPTGTADSRDANVRLSVWDSESP